MATIHTIMQGRVVGALACQRNSYLRSLETKVVSCVKWTSSSADHNGAKKKPTEASTASELWLIECADSVLFPEGGGQPADRGTILPLGPLPADTIPIQDVQRQGLRCLLHSPQPLSPGDPIRQMVDFTRRWDHMQQHTGQHLLSAVMDTYDNLKTIGWGMGKEGDMNYVDLPRRPSQGEMREIQDRCNELIRENLPIKVETPDDAKDNKLPDDYDKSLGVIRVVSIGDLDRNTCCGTHLSQTSHISLILLHSVQTVRSKNCRLYFTAGDRAIRLSTASVHALSSVARLMSCASTPDEVVDNVTKMRDASAELKKREGKLLLNIAEYEGDRVKMLLRAGKKAWVYRADGNLDFINRVISIVDETVKSCGGLIILATGEEKKTGPIVIYGEKGLVEATVLQVKGVVTAIKGGGKGGKWQGKVPVWQRSEMEALRQLVDS